MHPLALSPLCSPYSQHSFLYVQLPGCVRLSLDCGIFKAGAYLLLIIISPAQSLAWSWLHACLRQLNGCFYVLYDTQLNGVIQILLLLCLSQHCTSGLCRLYFTWTSREVNKADPEALRQYVWIVNRNLLESVNMIIVYSDSLPLRFLSVNPYIMFQNSKCIIFFFLSFTISI